MKLMIIKFWVTLTFYNSILIGSCIGGALPYLQSNAQQNQLLNRSPANSYGTPTIQPNIGQIQSQSLLNPVITQRPPLPPPPPPPPSQHTQSIQQNLIHQQQSSQHKTQQIILQSNNQQQQPQHSQQQQQQQLSIKQQLPLILPPPPLPVIPNQRQQIQHRQQQQQQPQQFQNRQQLYLDIQKSQQKSQQQQQQQNIIPQLSFQRSQDITQAVLNETPVTYSQQLSSPSENIFTGFQPILQHLQHSQQQNQLQSQQQQHQQQIQSQSQQQPIVQQLNHQLQYNKQISSLPLIAPVSLPPLQPGPTNSRIFSTSGTSPIGDQKIAANHIVVENYSTQDSDSFLTGAKNSTLYAAQLLAKSLLDASHENDANNSNNDSNNDQQLNKTDLVVVKTQKKAYIIPMNLQGHRLNQTQAQELYQNRDKLPVAYTVNQFLFIIKPENVNFLNKLV